MAEITTEQALEIVYQPATHEGLKRDHNEDAYACLPECGLWLVADGMGGHAHGEVASGIACETIVEAIRDGNTLRDSIAMANSRIIEHSVQQGDFETLPMGTTVVATRILEDACEIAWVGDSRAYLFNGGLTQLSRDHSYVNDLVQQGTISAEEARHHPHRNVITQALGVTMPDDLAVETTRIKLEPGMLLLLCSDGLTEEVEDAEISRILEGSKDLEMCSKALVKMALANGGSDNITLILLRAS